MCFASCAAAAIAAAWSCYAVLTVHDGDTLQVRAGGKKVTIRCAGYDAPELAQAYGGEAKAELVELVRGGVDFDPGSVDRYGRVIAYVRTSTGEDVALHMVRDGAAWWYRQFARGRVDLKEAEGKARADRRGLWARPGAVAPWEYRKHGARRGKVYR